MVVEAEEAEVVEEELVELVTDWAEKDTQQIETADADGKSRGVPGHEEVGHSMEVVRAIVEELVGLVIDEEVKDTLETKIKKM